MTFKELVINYIYPIVTLIISIVGLALSIKSLQIGNNIIQTLTSEEIDKIFEER